MGDVEFQQRCIGRIGTFGREGRTVVFVSHDLGAVAQLCPRSLWLDGGTVQAEGSTADIIDRYRTTAIKPLAGVVFPEVAEARCEIISLDVTDRLGRAKTVIRRGDEFAFRVRLRVREKIPDLDFGVVVANQRGVRVLEDYWADTRFGVQALPEPGAYDVSVLIPGFLPSGQFLVGLYVGTTYEIMFQADVMTLEVLPRPGDRQDWVERSRAVQPALTWQVAARQER